MSPLAPRRVIMVRMGELTLKGRNREGFVSRLLADVRNRLQDIPCHVNQEYDRLFVEHYAVADEKRIIDILSIVQGVHSLSACWCVKPEFDNLVGPAIELMKPHANKTFKIEARRSFKQFPLNSLQICQQLAPLVMKEVPLSVNVKEPEVVLFVEIRRGSAYLFDHVTTTAGGLPNKSGGRILVLLSGGIDSPVAGYLLARRGQDVDFLTFITPPHTSIDALQKTVDLVKRLRTITGQKSRLFVCEFTPLLHELTHLRYENYRIVVMRRYFMRIAAILAKRLGATALATGEAVGQVASQTLESISVIQHAAKTLVLRPLIAMDKDQIIKIAKQINTYEISIRPFPDACSLFAPAAPVTKPSLGKAALVEGDLDLAKGMVRMVSEQIKEYDFKPKMLTDAPSEPTRRYNE